VHRTVRCATGQCPVHQGRSTSTLHLRVSETALRYNSSDCPVCHRTVRCTSGATASQRNGRLQRSSDNVNSARIVRVESEQPPEGAPDSAQCMSGAAPDCPVQHEDKAPTVETVRTLTVGWRGWRTGHCPVRPSTDSLPNGYVVVEGYKYPPTTTTPSIQVFQTLHSI
jgi:hypothetical protein